MGGFLSPFLAFKMAIKRLRETRIDRRVYRFYERLRKVDGRSLFYIRGSQSALIKALVNKAHEEETEADSFSTQYGAKEFVFLAKELYFGTEKIIPREGDRIKINQEEYDITPGENGAYFDNTEAGGILVKVRGVRR